MLLRALADGEDDLPAAQAIQDGFRVGPSATPRVAGDFPADAFGFMRVLDFLLRRNGFPSREQALVRRFKGTGVGGPEPFDPERLAVPVREGVQEGCDEAQLVHRAAVASRTASAPGPHPRTWAVPGTTTCCAPGPLSWAGAPT